MQKLPSISIEVLSQLWEHRETIPLYVYMAINADDNGNFKVPPSRKIAKAVGATRYSVEKGLEILRRIGLISQISAKSQPNLSHATTIVINALSTSVSQISAKSRPNLSQQPEQKTVIVKDGYARFLEYFNEKVAHTPIKQVRTLSDARKNTLRSIFKSFGGKDTVEEVLDKVVASRWCCGENDKGWVASFDWIFNKSNFIKILEGNYDNRTNIKQTTDKYAARRGTDVGNLSEADYGGPF